MKVARRTDTELELSESPTLVALILGVLGVGGTWVLLRDGELLMAGGFVLLIVAIALASATATTCRFDRTSGDLTCARRSAFGTKHARHPLAEIAGVRTERSAARQSQAYRIVLDMSTGASVPLTTAFTSGRAGHEHAAEVIRAFLGLAQPAEVKIPGFGDLFRMAVSGNAPDRVGARRRDPTARD